MIFFRVFHQKVGLSAKVLNFSLLVGVAAIILGYLSAVLFQSRYSFLKKGEFVWGVGATFYGGLIGYLLFLSVRKKFEYTASVNLIVYGIWRFFIAFECADDRGASGIDALSPSQLTAIFLILAGIELIFLYKYVKKILRESR